jgi:hypothetical protein
MFLEPASKVKTSPTYFLVLSCHSQTGNVPVSGFVLIPRLSIVVLPNGTIAFIDEHDTDMFFALKGGLNRFGVVTSINYRAVPQPNFVYGGLRVYSGNITALNDAIYKFQTTNTDPRAALLYNVDGGVNFLSLACNYLLILFYDGPEKPTIFDLFDLEISPIIDQVKTQSYVDFVNETPSAPRGLNRGAFHTVPITGLTPNFINAVVNESNYYGTMSLAKSAL